MVHRRRSELGTIQEVIETAELHDVDMFSVMDPEDLWVYNKLQIAKMQGLRCGPAGVYVPINGLYVVRPVMNFSGMGAGAEVKRLTTNNLSKVPLGHFWCEILEGEQISVDYVEGRPWSSYKAVRAKNDPLYKFERWERQDKAGPSLPPLLKPLAEKYSRINVEYIDGKMIEVHLRGSPDPGNKEFIPVWKSDPIKMDAKFVPSRDNADGYLNDERLGFYIKD